MSKRVTRAEAGQVWETKDSRDSGHGRPGAEGRQTRVSIGEAADMHPVGTLVREDHGDDPHWPGTSTWLRIARWTPGRGTTYGWLCVRSDAPGNVLQEEHDGETYIDPQWFADLSVVGAIPGSDADHARVTTPGDRGRELAEIARELTTVRGLVDADLDDETASELDLGIGRAIRRLDALAAPPADPGLASWLDEQIEEAERGGDELEVRGYRDACIAADSRANALREVRERLSTHPHDTDRTT